MSIILKSSDEIAIMREAGRHVGEVLRILAAEIRPGMRTIDIDRVVEREFARRRVTSPFLHYKPHFSVVPYPAMVCVSVNDQIVHGIPGKRDLREGDIVSIDLGATYRGYVGDASITVACGAVSPEAQQLIDVTRESLRRAILAAQPGGYLGDVGHAVQSYAEPFGYGIVREYVGHGVGRSMHEEPNVPNYGTPGTGKRIKPGMVFAIEPMLNLGTHETRKDQDGWTIWTGDGAWSAHFEHTIAITPDGPLVLTLPGDMSQEDYLSGRAWLDAPRPAVVNS